MVSNWSTFPPGSTTSDPFSDFQNPFPVMTTNFNLQADQIYTTELLPNQGQGQVAVKPPRRRKKNKDTSSSGFRKRKLSEAQVNMLERSFEEEHKLESKRKDTLALELGLDPRQVAVWFQNRRARWKCKKLQDEYSKLMNEHKTALIQNCSLESEVLNLKGRLIEAQKEIERLLKRSSRNSPNSSSLSIEVQQSFLGEFGIDGTENVFYVPEYDNYANGFEWYKPF